MAKGLIVEIPDWVKAALLIVLGNVMQAIGIIWLLLEGVISCPLNR